MSNEYKVELKVLNAVMSDDNSAVIAGKLVSGDIYGVGRIQNFTCIENGGIWELEGKAFPSGTGYENGLRLFIVKHIEGSSDIHEGFTLVAN